VVAAINIIAGLIVWAHEQWFRKSVTDSSLEPVELKKLRRIPYP
jgi:hypothetical protein